MSARGRALARLTGPPTAEPVDRDAVNPVTPVDPVSSCSTGVSGRAGCPAQRLFTDYKDATRSSHTGIKSTTLG